MALPPSSGRRSGRPVRKSTSTPRAQDRSLLSRELEEIQRRELEIKKAQEEAQRRVETLPKEIEKREQKQREKIKLRAMAQTTTMDGFTSPRDKRHSVMRRGNTVRRMTRPEQRSARIQFLLLCLILGAILLLLWKSLP